MLLLIPPGVQCALLVVLNNWSEEIMHHIQITITRLYVEKKNMFT